MKAIASYSIKGGVGKTTAAVNLAHVATRRGVRVLLWDLDPQAAATFCLRVRPGMAGGARRLAKPKGELAPLVRASDHEGLDLVPADVSLRHLDLHLDRAKRPTGRIAELLDPLADDYDLAVLDCPPGVTLASESVLAAVDALVVPVVPSTLSRRTLDQLRELIADQRSADRPGDRVAPPGVWPFVSMLDRRRTLHREVVAELRDSEPDLLATVIPTASLVERMGVGRAPVTADAPRHPASVAFGELWDEIAARLWP